MGKKLHLWIASPKESRTAWIIASISIVVVAAAFIWPDFDPANSPDLRSETVRTTAQKAEASDGLHADLTKKDSESIKEIIVAVQEKHAIKSEPKPVQAPPPVVQKSTVQPKEVAKPTPSSKNTPKPPATVKSRPVSGYYVQLGAFKEKQRAVALQKKLASHWKAILKEKANNMTAVWVGPYPNSKEAEAAKHSIALRNKMKGFIVKN